MTVSSIIPVNNYSGNSSNKEFDFDFLIEDESELVVQHINSNSEIVTLTLGVDYSINEIGNENGSYITFPLDSSSYSVLSENETISLALSLVIKQESEFKNSSYFNFTILEWTFDYIVRILQIMNRQIERAIKITEGTNINADELIENIDIAVNNISTIDFLKDNITNITTVAENITDINTCTEKIEDIQNAPENAQTAVDKANEASTSANNAQIWAEGTDEEVEELGGVHSAKEWSKIYSQCADINLSNLSSEGMTVIDGQWVSSLSTILNSSTISSGTYTYDLSGYLPNDGYLYEVLFGMYAIGTSANTANSYIYTDVITNTMEFSACTSSYYSCNSIILPLKKYLYLYEGSYSAKIILRAYGYRRIGTNN